MYFYSIQKTNLPIVICLESFLVNNRLHNFSVFSVNLFFSGLSREAFNPLLKGGGDGGGGGRGGGGGGWGRWVGGEVGKEVYFNSLPAEGKTNFDVF